MYSTHEPPYPSSHVPYDSHAQFPRLPNIMPASYPPADTTQDHDDAAPESPPYTQSPHYDPRGRRNSYGRNDGPSQLYNPFADPEAIPLQQQHPKIVAASNVTEPVNTYDGPSHYVPQQNSPPRRKERFLSWKTPWVVYVLTIIQIAVFIAELIKNATLTHSPIEIHPQFNPMIGPSPYVLINMGARYVPCMKNVAGVQNSTLTIYWPCPNSTTSSGGCSLSDLCGFSGVPNPHAFGYLSDRPSPNQWFRFVTPIFLHAGLVHITFNMLLQIVLGREVERVIGHVRFFVVYFSSGIFGFIMGGNFAPPGIASTGASGSLFGIIAVTLLDLLYTWPAQRSPVKELLYLGLDIIVSFALGLLPGLDNFSHIGGFLMGLVLGICIMKSPKPMREHEFGRGDQADAGPYSKINPDVDHPMEDSVSHSDAAQYRKTSTTNSFSGLFRVKSDNRRLRLKPVWYIWQFVRAGALVGVLICFIALLRNFYKYDWQCSWCKYLSCLPVKDWCSIGDLDFTSTNN